MDTILFTDAGIQKVGVRIAINGRELIDIVREIELPFATAEGHPNIAGDYGYFGALATFLPARHFLGEPMYDWTDGEGRTFVLACTCGIPQCWALSVRLELSDNEVIWSDFRQPHRRPGSSGGEWRYDALGPFVFDRLAYEEQLRQQPAPVKVIPRKRTRKTRLAEVFNLGFRQAANARAASGIALGGERDISEAPKPPAECGDDAERTAWSEGYLAGSKCGASDAELASVDIPGAHGMIAGFDEDFMERFGLFKGLSEEFEGERPSHPRS